MTAAVQTRRTGARRAMLGGVIATAAGLGLSVLAAGLLGSTSPVPALGEAIIDLLPGPVVNFGKDTLGTADKPILMAIITVVALALGALAGLLEARRDWLSFVVIAPIAVISLIAAFGRPDIGAFGALIPVLVAVGTSLLLLRVLSGPPVDHPDPGGVAHRRRFFGWAIGGTALAAAGLGGGAALGSRGPGAEAQELELPAPAEREAVPDGVELEIDGLTPYFTPNKDFYRIDTALVVPRVSAAHWKLAVTGMVENPVTITFAELLARELVEHTATLTCVSNVVGGGLAGNARWLGLPIRDLLAEAKPLPGADMVLSRSADNFTAGTPLEVLTDPERQALLAIGMNGEPLPRSHGYPVRMVVPGLYGYVSATKWVVELKLTTFAADQGYWTPLGWSALGPIKIASRIDVPGGSVSAGEVVVAGVAWAQHTGIAAVEVRVDGGEWQSASLAEVTGPDTWRQWSYRWQAPPGEHTIECRAQDADGEWQTEAVAAPAPNGASGWHSKRVQVQSG